MKANYSAFPIPNNGCTDGLTMRDYIAIKAMQGLLANPNVQPPEDRTIGNWCNTISELSYVYADAMIAESEKSRG